MIKAPFITVLGEASFSATNFETPLAIEAAMVTSKTVNTALIMPKMPNCSGPSHLPSMALSRKPVIIKTILLPVR